MKLQPHAIKLEFVGSFDPKDADKLYSRFELENIEYYGEEDNSVYNGNSPFVDSPGGSSDREVQKVFVHNRDIKRAISVCHDLFQSDLQ